MATSSKKSHPRDLIIALPDDRLRQKSMRVGHIDASTEHLAQQMISCTLDWEDSRAHEFGAALAAIQIAQPYRVIIIRNDFEDKKERSFGVFINPEIIKTEGKPEEAMEGCLSVKDVYGSVPRYPKIKMKAFNLTGKEVRLTATGFLARVIQHEIDHCNGKLFVDHVSDPSKLFRLESDGNFKPLNPK